MDCIFVSYAQTDRCTIPEFANIVGLGYAADILSSMFPAMGLYVMLQSPILWNYAILDRLANRQLSK